MADINITTDFSEVNNLNNALKSTGDLFTKTVDSLVREEARAKRVTKRLADTTQANLDLITKADALVAAKVQQESLKREKTRTREAERAEKEANRIVAAAEKIARADAKLAEEVARNQAAAAQRSTAGLNQRLGVTGTAATGAGAGFGAIEGEIERLRIKYDQVYASSQLYERSLAELNTAHNLGVMSTKQHEAAVESLNQEYQNFQDKVGGAGNRFSQHINQVASGANRAGVLMQQLGYQAGDFVVQVQSGTNAFVAFGQQATQLVGFLPMLADELNIAKIGFLGLNMSMAGLTLGLSIIIPLLTAAGAFLMRTGGEAKSGADGLKEYQSVLEGLKSSLTETAVKLEALRMGLAPDDLFEAKLAISALQDEFISLTTTVGAASSDPWGLATRLAEITALRADLEKNLKLTQETRAEEQRLENAAKRRVNEQRNAYREAQQATNELTASLIKASNVNLASVFSKASPFAQSLLSQVNGLVGAMQNAAQNAAAWQMALLPGGSSRTGPDERGSQRGTVMGANTNMPDQPWMSPSRGGGGGGSGGGGGVGNSGLEALLTSLQTEREVIDEWYAESQAILQTASETELQIIGGSNEAKLRLEQEYQDKLKGIREISQNDALGNTATFFGHMATLTASGGDRLAKISKVFAAAEALINTYRAQAQVLADPSLPFLAKFGAVAAIGAAGFGLVNAIKSGGSSSTSKRGSAAVASPSASSPAPQTVFIDSLDPDGLYSGQALINLFDAFYDENDKRGKVFVVAR